MPRERSRLRSLPRVMPRKCPLTVAARAAGVVRDAVAGRLGAGHRQDAVGRPVRLVWAATGKSRADGAPEMLRLCTDRLGLTAELVALESQQRWWVVSVPPSAEA